MNNKLAYFVIGAILVVIAGASVLLLLNNQKQKPSSSTGEVHKQGTPTKNLSELQKQGWVGNITIIEGSALPEILTIEKDWAVSFTNQSTKDIEINITGDRDLMVVKIPAGKNMISPIFSNEGKYKYADAKNSKIKGEIIVGNLLSQSGASVSPSKPAVEIKNVSVVISASGFSPDKLTIDTNTNVVFENKTGKDFTIESLSSKIIPGNVFPSKLKREVMFLEGKYKLVNKNNASQTLEIVVTK
ncbi:MAG: hypothetical protein COX79_02635 [Candidatus Levybacteria bacterium CG_4_10_14_0_2_um_filter_36_16]|nr:MAG: hypothetical protein COX79_02635 [Candidatus Levybacteria bacterium CG_4_10_14_0_2_um_filter_36_16]